MTAKRDSEDDDCQNPLDVKLVKADIAVKHKASYTGGHSNSFTLVHGYRDS